MNYIRKSIALITVITILFLIPVNYVSADSSVIYQTSVKENVTSGATLEKITRFTTDGWQSIDVLKVDLGNPNIQVDSLTNTDSLMNLTQVKALADARGAVAAINSSFFNPLGKDNKGYVDGPIVESGKIISAVTGYNSTGDHMASFSIDNSKKVSFDFWKTNIKLVAPNGKMVDVAQYNKPSPVNYKDITVLDRRWGKTSIGSSDKNPELFEVVVVEGKITDMRFSQPAVEIPQNGFVIVTTAANGPAITNNFQIGDDVKLSINTTPDWSNLAVSMTGSAILLKNGKIPDKFSMNIAGRQPRTAIGCSKSGTQLIIVTVDGRQNLGIGMTQTELANFLASQGAYNALNFDGGGSTTMVARQPGDSGLSVINSPSDGAQRYVAAGLGIFSIAPPSELNGLIIDTDDKSVFVNGSRSFTVSGYDRYLNPITLDPNQITFSASGVQGSFKGNTFYPKSSGKAVIKATVGNLSAEFTEDVLGNPVEINLNYQSLKLPLNATKKFSATGKDKAGFTSTINPQDINWTVNGNIGSFNGNTFSATGQGTGFIDASIGNTHAYCGVSVASSASTVIDGFEQANGSFISSPTGLGGDYSISNEYTNSGSYSGKLTYDFTNTEGTRAAYMVFPGNGLTLAPNTDKLGLWVYNTHSVPNWLRAEVYDSSGSKQILEFTKDMNWSGWKYLEVSLDGIDGPARLTRIYLAQVSPVSDSGSIYLDDLTQVSSSYPALTSGQIPEDTKYKDPYNKTVTYKKTANSFRFSVFGQTSEPKNLLQKLLVERYADKTNSSLCDMAVLLGSGTHKITSKIKVNTITTSSNYKAMDIKNSRLIQLDTSKKGLRLTDPKQWSWFLDKLNTFTGNNIFIFMSDSPKNFSDGLEGNLFRNILSDYQKTKGKNVWVIYKNTTNSTVTENGVKYFSTAGYDIKGLNSANAANQAKYLLVTVIGSDISYEFKPSI
ncbi:MAG: phosphodiester glycosidase family protein [Bacillota bacterium]|nr:phosphodiester glycosidase family protein [Bacillota bacterium]